MAQNTAPLEGRDAADRAQEYRERIRSAVVPAKPLTVFALPEPSRSNPSPVALLKSTPITKEDVEFVRAAGTRRALSSVRPLTASVAHRFNAAARRWLPATTPWPCAIAASWSSPSLPSPCHNTRPRVHQRAACELRACVDWRRWVRVATSEPFRAIHRSSSIID